MPPGLHFLMMLAMISLPLGEMQQMLFGGLTIVKVILPIIFVYILCVYQGRMIIHPLLLPYILFVFCTLPSLITGVGFGGILLSLLGYILLFQVLCFYSASLTKIEHLMSAYVAALLVMSVLTLQTLITDFDIGKVLGKPFIEYFFGVPLVSGPSNNPNGFASMFMPGIPFAYAFFLGSTTKLKKFAYLGVLIVLFLALISTFSRSAIGAAFLACIVVHHHQRNPVTFCYNLFFKLLGCLLLVILASSVYYFLIELITMDVGTTGDTDLANNKSVSGGYRTLVLIPMTNILIDNLFLGVGFGNVKHLIEAETGLFINSHNTPFGIAMDYGIFALFFIAVTILLSIRDLTRAIKLANETKTRLLVSAFLASLAAMIFHGLFHEIYVHILLWFPIIIGPVIFRTLRRV